MVREAQIQDWEACGFCTLVRRTQSYGGKWGGDVKSPTASFRGLSPCLPHMLDTFHHSHCKRSTAFFSVAPGTKPLFMDFGGCT